MPTFAPYGLESAVVDILRVGEMTLETMYDPVAGEKLSQSLQTHSPINCTLVFPDDSVTEWTLSAYVMSYEPNMAVDSVATASIGLKMYGSPEWGDVRINKRDDSVRLQIISMSGPDDYNYGSTDSWEEVVTGVQAPVLATNCECEYCGQDEISKYGACVGCGYTPEDNSI